MLPVVAPMNKVAQQMWFHTIAMIVTSFLTLYSYGLPLWSYLVTAALGVFFAVQLLGLNQAKIDKQAGKIFHSSITYLSLYSVLLVVVVLI